MKFLLDQDVYALTARFLQSLGHELTLWLSLDWLKLTMRFCWPERVSLTAFL
jgi:hypothetical protein